MTPEQRVVFWSSWRKGVVLGLVALVICALAFSAGRFSAPEVVQTRDVDHWKTLDLRTEDITRGFTFARQVEVTRWRDVKTKITTTPDAGTVTEITDNTIEHEGAIESGSVTEQLRRVEIVEVERIVEKEVTVTLRPTWRVSGFIGASVVQPLFPIAGPLVVGGSAEHRITGGVSAGGWIIPQLGAGGFVASGEF